MRRFTIEQLVNWAYRDQMVHAARSEFLPVEASIGYSPRLAASDMSADKVDGGGRADFTAHHDAYRVHEAVIGLGDVARKRSDEEIGIIIARRMCAEIFAAHNRRFDSAQRDSLAAGRGFDGEDRRAHVMEASVMMRDMFTGAPKIIPTIIDPLRVEIVRRPQLVMSWAMKGQRPDWIDGPHYGWERGRAVYEWGGNRSSTRSRRSLFHLVNPSGDDPFDVEQARGVFAAWVDCLAALRAQLAGKLTNHQLADTLPEREPWKFSGKA